MRQEFIFYGAAREMARSRDPEIMLHGPAETGKSLSTLWKAHVAALNHQRASIVLLRKTLASAHASVIQQFQLKVLMDNPDVRSYGGAKPEWFDYRPTGSRIWVAGLDKSSKILSSEHDMIVVNQAEELTEDDWEVLTTRVTGRAGNMPYSQLIGDCNPAWPTHWMYHRPGLRLLYSRHQDNPVLFDQASGEITPQGKRTMETLERLTGVRRDRLLLGKPSQAEGAVYDEWSAPEHLVECFEIPESWRRIRSIDFGYTNPFVCQWWAISPDGVMYRYREIYMSQMTVSEHAREILGLSRDERIEATVCDHDAEDRATLSRCGIPNIAAEKAVQLGIQTVKDRLASGRLRLFRDALVRVDTNMISERRPTRTEDEIDAYVWNNRATAEVPVKEDDHGVDALRYAVMYVDGKRRMRARSRQG